VSCAQWLNSFGLVDLGHVLFGPGADAGERGLE
jgi:hypothetical protein